MTPPPMTTSFFGTASISSISRFVRANPFHTARGVRRSAALPLHFPSRSAGACPRRPFRPLPPHSRPGLSFDDARRLTHSTLRPLRIEAMPPVSVLTTLFLRATTAGWSISIPGTSHRTYRHALHRLLILPNKETSLREYILR